LQVIVPIAAFQMNGFNGLPMQFRFTIIVICYLVGTALAGCSSSNPQQEVSVEPVEKPKVDELKTLDGLWLLKSSMLVSERGVYPINTEEGGQLVLRINNGATESRRGDGPWTKYDTLTLGEEPQCLLSTKVDASGRKRIVKLRYKLEGNAFITAQDNLFLDILPESFDTDAGIDRHRQINTYVKTDR
jgi:hypothetical protein